MGAYKRDQCRYSLDDVGTAETTSAAGGNETDLLAGGSRAAHGRGVTDVLVVTTTVGVLHGVHGHTTHLHDKISTACTEDEQPCAAAGGVHPTQAASTPKMCTQPHSSQRHSRAPGFARQKNSP